MLVQLTHPSGGAIIGGGFGSGVAIVRIVDNDYASGKIEWVGTNFEAAESADTTQLAIRRIGGSVGEVFVSYGPTADSTAEEGVNYTGAAGMVTWADGETGVKAHLGEPDRQRNGGGGSETGSRAAKPRPALLANSRYWVAVWLR